MENLAWGLQMTVLGMGLVFGLLALLWGLLALVLRLDKEAPALPVADQPPAPAAAAVDEAAAASGAGSGGGAPAAVVAPTAAVDGLEADLVAAITVAVLTHRAVRRREAAPVMRSYWPGSMLYASRWVAIGRSRQNHSWQRRGK